MRKILLTAVLALAAGIALSAQPREAGLRAGYGIEAVYQHSIGNNFIEGDLGYWHNCFNVAAAFDFVIAQPQWTTEGTWTFYAGPGVGFSAAGGAAAFSINAQIGLEYAFESIPLSLSLDWRPSIVSFTAGGSYWLASWSPAIGVRYCF